jgi:hypothetical protein
VTRRPLYISWSIGEFTLSRHRRAARSFKVNAVTIRGIVGAFNVFNANTVLGRNNHVLSTSFNAIAQNLSPRIVRVGLVVGV